MDNEDLVQNWHNAIINECESRLKRKLTDQEKLFIESRSGFIALEMIEDTVKTMDGSALEGYLNSESKKYNMSIPEYVKIKKGKDLGGDNVFIESRIL